MKFLDVFSPADSSRQLALVAKPADQKHSAVVVDIDHIISLRDDWILKHSLERRTQVRPFYMFNGAAEFEMLVPIAKLVATTAPDLMSFMMSLAKNMSVVARSASSLKSQQAVASMANLISSLSTDTTSPGLMAPITQIPGSNAIKVTNGYEYFTSWLYDVIGSPSSREAIFKQLSNPTAKPLPAPLPGATNPSATIINDLIQGMIVFGFNGSGAPLLASELPSALASRLAIENEISDPSSFLFVRDRKLILALWYYMYCEATATPDAYNAAFPAVPMSPNNLSTAGSIVSKAGSVCHTAFACATAPATFGIEIMRIQIEHAVQFLETLSASSSDTVGKIKYQLSCVNDELPQFGYSPMRNLASSIMTYLSDFTGSRFLLPGFFAKYTLTSGVNSFPTLSGPTTIEVPPGYRGFTASTVRASEFGGLDVPMLLEQLLTKAKDLNAACMNIKRIHGAIIGTLPVSAGAVLVHLDGLDKLPSDPALGTIEYPSLTRRYLLPSYVPKWIVDKKKLTPLWSFEKYLYKAFFPRKVQRDYLLEQSLQAALCWVDEVDLAVSPSSGQEFSYLPIPSHFTQDADTSVIPNDIRAVKQFLAASPHRPMADVTDFFTPMYQVLAMGQTRRTAVANALASIGFLYEAVKPGSAPKTDGKKGWQTITPQISTIYGAPTDALLALNDPWSTGANLSSRMDVSPDGNYLFVLHKFLPPALWLSYVPFVMFGGCTISLPVSTAILRNAIKEVKGSTSHFNQDMQSLYGPLLQKVADAPFTEKEAVEVKAWSMNISSFPHVFVSNRYTSSAHAILTAEVAYDAEAKSSAEVVKSAHVAIEMLETKHVIAGDQMSPFGSILSFQETPVAFVDISDQLTAYQGSAVNDLTTDQRSNKTKATTGSPGAAPLPSHQDIDPLIDPKIENSDQGQSGTTATGDVSATPATAPPGVSSPVTIPEALPLDLDPVVIADAEKKTKGKGDPGVPEGSDPTNDDDAT